MTNFIMPQAQPVLVKEFQAEPAKSWPEDCNADADKTMVMGWIGGLIRQGEAEWGWLADGDIELRLSSGAVFHLRAARIERIV